MVQQRRNITRSLLWPTHDLRLHWSFFKFYFHFFYFFFILYFFIRLDLYMMKPSNVESLYQEYTVFLFSFSFIRLFPSLFFFIWLDLHMIKPSNEEKQLWATCTFLKHFTFVLQKWKLGFPFVCISTYRTINDIFYKNLYHGQNSIIFIRTYVFK